MRTQPIYSVELAIKKASDELSELRGVVGYFGESLAQTRIETKF